MTGRAARILALLALLFFSDQGLYEQSYRIAAITPFPAAEKVGYVTLEAVSDYESPEAITLVLPGPAAGEFAVGDSITVTITRRGAPVTLKEFYCRLLGHRWTPIHGKFVAYLCARCGRMV